MNTMMSSTGMMGGTMWGMGLGLILVLILVLLGIAALAKYVFGGRR